MQARYDRAKIPQLTPAENTEILTRYVRHCELSRATAATIKNKVSRVGLFLKWAGVKADGVTPTMIEDYFLDRMDRLSLHTIDGDVIEFRVFFKWLLGEEKAKVLLKNIKKSHKKRELPVEQLLTREDVQKLIGVCERQRDRALIALLWDSGARITEVLNIDVGDLAFDKFGASVIVDGKTGRRKIRLVSSVPDIRAWLEQHPYGTDPRAPLFVTSRSFTEGTPRRLAGRTVNTHMLRIGPQAGVYRPCNPHAIRHARLTDLTKQGLSEMELRIFAGWSSSSAMPDTYVHLSGGDVEKKLLRNAGLLDDEEDTGPGPMDPVKCPRCRQMNAPGARFCMYCMSPMSEKVARQVDQAEEAMREAMTADPDLLIKAAEIIRAQRAAKD